MKNKYLIVIISFLIFAVGSTRAELQYESDYDHSFVVTGGKLWFTNNSYDDMVFSMDNRIDYYNTFTLKYKFKNKVSFGFSKAY